MATVYIEKEGGYSAALTELLEKGGQLFTGDDKDGCTTIVRGCYVTRFWAPNSAKKGKLIEACKTFGYDPYGMTGGSLCRKIITDLLELKHKETPFSNTYRKIAVDGSHWHYQHLITGNHGHTIEFDLTSAYMTQYLALPSMLLVGNDQFIDDDGAMEKLKQLMPLFPKWLRVQFLGVLASHSRTTITRVKNGTEWDIKKSISPSISYGGAFNSAHRAILRVYRIMEKIHSILGEHCKRMHTDSFLMSQATPVNLTLQVFEYLESLNQDVQIKAMGRSYFMDLNQGIIGKKLVGNRRETSDNLKEMGYKQDRNDLDPLYESTWEDIIHDIKEGFENRKSIPVSYEQAKLVLFKEAF